MKYIDAISPEGQRYQKAIPEGPEDLPDLLPSQKMQLALRVKERAAKGTLVRGTTRDSRGGMCVLGIALHELGIRPGFGDRWQSLVHANNQNVGSGGSGPVAPQAVEELLELIDKCGTAW